MSGDMDARSSKNEETRPWVVLQSQTTTKVYRGIFATDHDDAMHRFLVLGEGELALGETRYGEWELDSEPDSSAPGTGASEAPDA